MSQRQQEKSKRAQPMSAKKEVRVLKEALELIRVLEPGDRALTGDLETIIARRDAEARTA